MPRLAAFAQTSAALSRIHLKSVATLWAVVPLDAWRDNCAGKVPIGVRVAASQQRCGATAADPTSDLDDPFRPSKARAARNRAQGERSIPRITVHARFWNLLLFSVHVLACLDHFHFHFLQTVREPSDQVFWSNSLRFPNSPSPILLLGTYDSWTDHSHIAPTA